MAIAPLPISMIIMTAATTQKRPTMTITHPIELIFFSDQPVVKRNNPDRRHHNPKMIVSVFIVANTFDTIDNPKAKVNMLHRRDILSLSILSLANQAIIPARPAAIINIPNQIEMPASTAAGLLKM
jgi:hypothetical protein